MTPTPRLILASGSPRRRALMQALRLEFEVVVSHADESSIRAASPREHAIESARLKAQTVRDRIEDPGALVIGADTIVVLGDCIMGKPRDAQHGNAMLADLAGRTHEVITGLAIDAGVGEVWTGAERTEVTFRCLSHSEIEDYVRSGQGADKAGGYGFQGVAGRFIDRIEGDPSNVIGLPLGLLRGGLDAMGLGRLLDGRSLRLAVREAFGGLADLPEELWAGIPD